MDLGCEFGRRMDATPLTASDAICCGAHARPALGTDVWIGERLVSHRMRNGSAPPACAATTSEVGCARFAQGVAS